MTLTALTPDIVWIVPWAEVQQLCHLWRQFGMAANAKDRIYINGDQLLETGFPLEHEVFQVLADPEFTAVLWGNAHLSSRNRNQEISMDKVGTMVDEYEICLSFDPQVLDLLTQSLVSAECPLPQLEELQGLVFPHHSQLPSHILLPLLNTLRSPQVKSAETVDNPPVNVNRPLNSLLNNRLEQERILNNVTHRIYQNQDLMVTVRMALEQVQKLLRVDRLLVYQFDVATENNPTIPLNRVTFEVLSGHHIQPLFHHEESLATKLQQDIQTYYEGGQHLAISKTKGHPRFNLCPPELSDVEENQHPTSILSVPLVVDNRLWGLLIAHQCTSPRRWRKNEIAFLYHVADYLAIAILQARSYQQLQEQKNNLESLAQQRAKELEDALLSARVASQSKREFIHVMSHELLTPLTSIIGLSNTLSYWSSQDSKSETKLSADKQLEYLKSIHSSGIKLRNLLQDILDFSQAEAAQSFLDLQNFSLRQLCLSAINSFRELSDRQGLTLKLINRVEPENELFCADPIRIEKILHHLLSNAIKFTPHGGQVTLTIWREKQNDVLLQIKDTGIGIPPQQMPLLFEKFQQLEPSMSRSHDGAGFGLALVKQLVEIHQGQIHVTSTPKQGSIFTVRIPCQNQQKNPIDGSLNDRTLGGTIVLISQDEEVATLICDLLTATNYQVIWLFDSAIALSQITVLQPSLVLLDAQQQGEGIEDIIHKIRNTPQTQQIPALLISDPLSEQAWRQLQKRGFRDYVRKPIQGESLINLVNYQMISGARPIKSKL